MKGGVGSMGRARRAAPAALRVASSRQRLSRAAAVLLLCALCASALPAPAAAKKPAGKVAPLARWSPNDVRAYLEARPSPKVPPAALDALVAAGFSGVLAFYATAEDLVDDVGLDAEAAAIVDAHLAPLRRGGEDFVLDSVSPPLEFWSWRALHRAAATHYGRNLFLFPRLLLPYVALFDDETMAGVRASAGDASRQQVPDVTLEGVAGVWWLDAPAEALAAIAEAKPPTDEDGWVFWAWILLAPHLLVAWHALGFLGTNFWVSCVVVVSSLSSWTAELSDVWRLWREGKSFASHYVKQWRVSAVVSFAYFVLWPVIPWFVCDLLFWLGFLWAAARVVVDPVLQLWRGGAINYAIGIARIALLSLPLAFDDESWWDLAIFLGLALPVVGTLALLSRRGIGALTPSQLRAFLPFLTYHFAPQLTVDRRTLLASSVTAVNAVPGMRMRSHRGRLVISFRSEAGIAEEGIDAGGLFRSWVTQAAGAAFRETAGFTAVVQMPADDAGGAAAAAARLGEGDNDASRPPLKRNNSTTTQRVDVGEDDHVDGGTAVVRLRVPAESPQLEGVPDNNEVFRFIGRLIGISWQQQLPLGVTLAPPLCRLLVATDADAVELTDADARFVAPDEAKWVAKYVADGDEDALEDLDLHFVDGESGEGLCGDDAGAHQAVTVKTGRAYLAALARHAFRDAPGMRAVLAAARAGLRDVMPADEVARISAGDLRRRIAGDGGDLDVNEWRRHTSVKGPSSTGASPPMPQEEMERVSRAFWSVVEEMEAAARTELLFFVTGRRCLPPGGFQALPSAEQMSLWLRRRDDASLPVAHTCMSALELPCYSSAEVLQERLAYAVEHGGNSFGSA